MNDRPCRLYLITPPALELPAFAADLEAALAGGDVACVQLRLKDVPDEAVIAAARVLAPICHAADVALILNDRPDLARAVEADGAHVGQQDMAYAEARRILGPDRIVGVTAHDSRHLAIAAAEAGADYVAFGAFFPTATKAATARADLDLLRWWAETIEVPCVAIGGITVENCPDLVRAGADFLAVSAGVWHHAAGPKAAVAAFNEAIEKAAENPIARA